MDLLGNKKLKRDLVLQSFAPLFIILMIKHAHCYWKQAITFFQGLLNHDWSVFSKAYHHAFFADSIVFVIASIWVVWAVLVYFGFCGILKVKFESRGENICMGSDKRDGGATFLVSFVLPLLVDDVSTLKGAAVFTFMLAIVIGLLIKSNLFYQNPILTILNYKTFEFQFLNPYVDVEPSKTYIGITKGTMITEKVAIKRKYIADDVFIIFNT